MIGTFDWQVWFDMQSIVFAVHPVINCIDTGHHCFQVSQELLHMFTIGIDENDTAKGKE